MAGLKACSTGWVVTRLNLFVLYELHIELWTAGGISELGDLVWVQIFHDTLAESGSGGDKVIEVEESTDIVAFARERLGFDPDAKQELVLRGGRRLRVRPRADAWAVGSGLLQLAESGVGFVMDSLESGFVTGHQRQAAGLIGERSDGHGEMNVGIGGTELLADFVAVADHFAIDEDCFRADEAADAPAGDCHLID